MHARQINMSSRPELRRSENFADDAVSFLAGDFEFEQPIIDQNGVTDVNVLSKLIVIYRDRILFRWLGAANCELEDVTLLQDQLRFDRPRSNRRTLGIEQNADRSSEFVRDFADSRDNCPDPFRLRVTHIQSKHICAMRDQLPNDLWFLRCRAECADDFGLPH